MRLAYVCTDAGVPVFGHKGCSIHVQEFLRAVLKTGASVLLYPSRLGGHPDPGLQALEVCEIPLQRGVDTAGREQALLAANGELRRMLERDGPFDLIYERYSLFSYSAMEYAQLRGVPAVLEVNAPLIEEQSQYRTLIDRGGAETAARRAFQAASTLVAVSEEVATYLAGFHQARGRVVVVPNGVDPERFRPPPNRAAFSERTFIIGFVGSLKPWHGLPTLLEAFATLAARAPDARLLIVGDGPERERLVAWVAARAMHKAVYFRGAVNHRDVPGLLASMDVAVAPYPQLSNFYFSPLKIYEYMAAGLPVVASRIGQVAKLIQDGVSGLLYEPGNAGELLESLERLRLEPGLRSRLGCAARAEVLRGHTWNAVVERILQISRLQLAPGAGYRSAAT